MAEEKSALERRRQAHEESRLNRHKEPEATADEDGGALEKLLINLRNGDTISRKARRRRPAPESQLLTPLPSNIDGLTPSNDASHIARDMLARLQSDGFAAIPPVTTQRRRRRRRTERTFDSEETPGSPLAMEIQEYNEDSVSETQDLPSDTS
jgi:cytokinesis protein